MTSAERALEHVLLNAAGWPEFHKETIIRALKIAAAVDGDGLVMKQYDFENEDHHYVAKGNNDLLERLRAIDAPYVNGEKK